MCEGSLLTVPFFLLAALQDHEGVVREYWRLLEPVGIHSGDLSRSLDRALTREDDRAFEEAHARLVVTLARAAREVGISAPALRKALIGGEVAPLVKRIDEVWEKLGEGAQTRARDLRLLLLPSIDLRRAMEESGRAGEDLRVAGAYVCRALVGMFHSELTRGCRLPRSLEDDAAEILGTRPDEAAWFRGYLRIASDRVFLTHMTDPDARGPRVSQRRDLPDDAAILPYLVGTGRIGVSSPRFRGGAAWSAYLRWHVAEDMENPSEAVARACEAEPDNAYFAYLHAYFQLFEGKGAPGWARLAAGNRAGRYDPYSKEILHAFALAHEGPLRWFFALYVGAFPHSIRFFELSNTYVDQRVGELLQQDKTDEAWKLLEESRTFLRRAKSGAVIAREIVGMLAALRGSLSKQAMALQAAGRHDAALALHRQLVEVERDSAAIETAVRYPAEFEFLAAGVLMETGEVEKRWERRRAEGFDAALVAAARKRYEEHVVPAVLKEMPEFGGDVRQAEYREALAAFEERRYADCVLLCARAIAQDRNHLHAIELKRQALERLGR